MVVPHRAFVTHIIAAALGCLLTTARPVTAADEPTTAAVFNDQVLHEIRFVVNSDDWQLLREHYLEDTYYPADFTWDGFTVRNAGIRSRGTGSRDPVKPSLKVAFDEYVTDQGFAGLKSLVLDNFRQDPGMMKESLSMQLFRKMGVPAPRVVHARVYVNNTYLGLYAAIEPIDKRFLKANFGESAGYLYEYEWADGYHLEWRGPTLDRYAGLFTPKTHESESDEQLYRPLEAMISAVNRAGHFEWEAEVGARLDLEKMMEYMATEMFLSDHDGFAGDWGLNNFYIYRRQDSDRFLVLPWDKDTNFREADRSVFEPLAPLTLFTTAFEYPHWTEAYTAAVRKCAAFAIDGATAQSPGWLEREVAREAALISDAAHADPSKPYTNDRFDQEVAWLLTFAHERARHVLAQVTP